MSATIDISSGVGDGDDVDGSTTTFAGSPSGAIGTVLATDTTPTTIFESELEGIAPTTNIAIAASDTLTWNSSVDLAQTAGNSVTITAPRFNVGGTITTAGGALTINAPQATIGTLNANSVNTNGGLLTLNFAGIGQVQGGIAGAGAVVQTAGGVAFLYSDKTYTGLTNIAGVFVLMLGGRIEHSSQINLTHATGALNLGATADTTITTLNGVADSHVFLGPGTLTLSNASHTYAGNIEGGSGGLRLATGTETLTGTSTYHGPTTIENGTLVLAGSGSIAGSSEVNLASAAATFDISGTISGTTIRGLSGVANSHVELGAKTLTISNGVGPPNYAGIIHGAGGLEMMGGYQTLSGANTYVGDTIVANNGTLLVDGSIAASKTFVSSLGVLGGNGTTGDVTITDRGFLIPGGPVIGTIHTGNVTLAASATLQAEITGTAGGQYDQVEINGTVDLADARLFLILLGGFDPGAAPSATMTLIDNDGTDAVIGHFAGLQEGAWTAQATGASTGAFVVSYVGGDGNDVTLTTARLGAASDDSYVAAPGDDFIIGLGGIDTVTFGLKLTDATITWSGNQVIVDGPSSHAVVTGFERFVFTDGTVDNADGGPLVDDLFYYSQNHDVWNAHVDADQHYNVNGCQEGRDPDAFFSTSIYVSANPDVNAAGVNPLRHFDQFGWHEGRVPSLNFDLKKYLDANPDVAAANVDPLAHFLQFGAQEGRQQFASTELIAANGFDYVYYLAHNPDVGAAGVDPFVHFQTAGWREGRDPNALFDTAGYLANYVDVTNAHINPLDHYHQFGWREGRDPSLAFDTAAYLAANQDVAAAHTDPLEHFLHFGIHEGRMAFADGTWG